MKKTNPTIFFKLFLHMFYISTFTFGGGFVIVTFMKKSFVDKLHWLQEDEMLDIIALAQTSPGAIAVNASILLGWKVAGFKGMIFSVLGTVTPPVLIISIVSLVYNSLIQNIYVETLLKGMQTGVAAVLINVVFEMIKNIYKNINRSTAIFNTILLIFTFIASYFFKINVIYIIVFAILIGIIFRKRGQ